MPTEAIPDYDHDIGNQFRRTAERLEHDATLPRAPEAMVTNLLDHERVAGKLVEKALRSGRLRESHAGVDSSSIASTAGTSASSRKMLRCSRWTVQSGVQNVFSPSSRWPWVT